MLITGHGRRYVVYSPPDSFAGSISISRPRSLAERETYSHACERISDFLVENLHISFGLPLALVLRGLLATLVYDDVGPWGVLSDVLSVSCTH